MEYDLSQLPRDKIYDLVNGLGAYVKTKDAFFHMPRMTYEEWKQKDEKGQAA